MAAPATQLTAKIGDSHFDDASGAIESATGVTTRALNLSEPDNGDDIEVMVVSIKGKTVRLGIRAPKEMQVSRRQCLPLPIAEEACDVTQEDGP